MTLKGFYTTTFCQTAISVLFRIILLWYDNQHDCNKHLMKLPNCFSFDIYESLTWDIDNSSMQHVQLKLWIYNITKTLL